MVPGIFRYPYKGVHSNYWDGFLGHPHQIAPTGEENIAGLSVLYNATNPNARVVCDCKINDCQYFDDTNTVYCLDENGKRIESSAPRINLFIPFVFMKFSL